MRQTGINMEMVKKRNRASILKYIVQNGPISRKDISEALGLTPASVTQICGEFMTNGVLVETGTLEETNRAGRKKVLVDINYNHRCVLGINIDLEKTVIVLTNFGGEIIRMREILTAKTQRPEKFLQIIADNCLEMQENAGIDTELIIGAGVGIVGEVDRENGISLHAYGIWGEEVPVAELLSGYLKLPVIVENIVASLATAGLMYGLGSNLENLMLVKWGPGVGCAIVANGEIYGGKGGKAAKLAHYIIEKDGLQCSCGRRGCLETRISFAAFSKRLEQMFSVEETPKLYETLQGDFGSFSRDVFYEMLNDPDDTVMVVLKELLDTFARVIVSCMTILAPNLVILCGDMFRNEVLCQKLIEFCKAYDERYDETKIVHTALADREKYIGPIAVMVQEYLYEGDDLKQNF